VAQPAWEARIVRALRPTQEVWGRARRVARLADDLFQHSTNVHGLTRTAEPLLEATALLHAAGAPEEATRRVRLSGLPALQRRIVAGALHLCRDTVGPTVLTARPTRRRPRVEFEVAARIAAIVRLADALHRGDLRGTSAIAIVDDGRRLRVHVAGGRAAADAARAGRQTALWNALLARPIDVTSSEAAEPANGVTMRPGESVVEVVRRICRRQFEELTSREYGLDYDWDVEYVHEMRIATRRLRSALRVLGKSLGPQCKMLGGELAQLTRALGPVRDDDVFLQFLEGYVRRAKPKHRAAVRKLIRSVRRARRRRYRRLQEAFACDGHDRFRQLFQRIVAEPVGSPSGLQAEGKRATRPIWKAARRALRRAYKRLAPYGRRLGRLSIEQQHRLRIDCKRLRYTAESFADIYGKPLKRVARGAMRMQALLGDMHDIDVWSLRIRRWGRRQRAETVNGVPDAMVEHLADRRAACLRKAKRLWRRFTDPKTRKRAAKAIRNPKRS